MTTTSTDPSQQSVDPTPVSPPPAPPPPPPMQPGSSATGVCQHCPLDPLTPCDVEKLLVDVVGKDENQTEEGNDAASGPALQPGKRKDVPLKLETTAVRRGEVVTDVTDKTTLALLGQYDLLIEAIADYPSNDSPKPTVDPNDTVKLKRVYAQYVGSKCSVHEHALLQILPRAKTKQLEKEIVKQKVGAQSLSYDDAPLIYARSLPFDTAPSGEDVFALFDFIRSLFHAMDPADVAIFAKSCGVRPNGANKAANKELSALLRIYRRDKWGIGLKVPPLGKFHDERSADSFGDLFGEPEGDYKRSQETSVGGPYLYKSTTESEREGNTSKESQEVWFGSVGGKEEISSQTHGKKEYETTTQQTSFPQGETPNGKPVYGTEEKVKIKKSTGKRTIPKNASKLIEERLKTASGFELVVFRNDKEVRLDDLLERVKKSIKVLSEALCNIQSFLKMVPQLGWKFTFDVSVFAGTVQVDLGPEYVKGPIAKGRYFPVQYKVHATFVMTLIDLMASLSFGFEAKAAGTGLTVKAELVFKLKAKIEHEFNLDLLKPKEKFPLTSEASVEPKAVADASILGYTLAHGEVGVSTGLALDGYLEIDWREKKFELRGVLSRKAVILSGEVHCPIGSKPMDPIEIFPKGDLHTFG